MDIQILLILQYFRELTGGVLNGFLTLITNIGVDYYVAIPALILFWAVDKKKGAQIFLIWGTSLFANAALKTTFCVYRPWIRSSAIHPLESALPGATGYSFPSGHSSSSSGFYFGLYSVYRKYKGICIFAVIMTLLTMFSRIYAGVHTPQDVLVGGLIGVFVTVMICRAVKLLEEKPDLDWAVILIATIASVALLCFIYFREYPMDYADGKLLVDPKKMTVDGFKDPGRFYGILLGWFIERRYVKFDISGTAQQKVCRCLFGAVLYVLYWTVVCDYVGKAIGFGPAHFLCQASCQVIFMTLYPWFVTTKIERKNSDD